MNNEKTETSYTVTIQTQFAALYSATFGFASHAARRLGLASHEVDDALQEAFIKLLNSHGTYTLAGARSYLVKTLRCGLIDQHRRDKSRRTEAIGELMDVCDKALWVSDRDHDLALEALAQAVEAVVSPQDRAFLAWFYRDGLSVREISEKTGQKVGTVTAKLCRLREKYATRLRQEVEARLAKTVAL